MGVTEDHSPREPPLVSICIPKLILATRQQLLPLPQSEHREGEPRYFPDIEKMNVTRAFPPPPRHTTYRPVSLWHRTDLEREAG